MGEITVILLLALIFLGPKKLPDLATGLGKLIREIRKATSDIKSEITLDDSFRKPFEELRDAVTLHPDELKRRDQMKKVVDEARLRDEAAAREAAAAAAIAAAALPTTAPAEPAALTSGARDAPFDAQVLPPIPPQFLTSAGPPAGTVARSRVVAPADGAAAEAGPAAAIMTSAPVPSPSPSSSSSSSPLPGPPRVTPPISSLSGDRAHITQSLSEADLLPNTQPRQRRPTPPPLPGLDKTPSPPIGHLGAPRVMPPVSSLSGDRANVTQALSESDLLPPATPTLPAGASKPPPLPGSKKT
jgi:Sec-independent protein translocase protein TatA